jgi:MFS family permease
VPSAAVYVREVGDGGADDVDARGTGVPSRYWVWLGGQAVSLTGVEVLSFAMAWVAAGTSGLLAGIVLTAGNLPHALLLLTGGAVADRVGLWRVLLIGYGVMVALLSTLAVMVTVVGSPAWLLVGAAALIGSVEALYRPAGAAVPLELVPRAALARALSSRQVAQQASGFLGPVVGGLVIAAGGLVLAASVNAVTFVVMVCLVLALRPRRDGVTVPASSSLWAQSVDGIRVVARDPLLRSSLLLLFFVAGILLPVVGLLIPVLARQQGWPASTTGWALGGFGLGYAAVALLVSFRGLPPRPGLVAILGIAVAGLAAGVLAYASSAVAPTATVVIGIGAGAFASSLGPLVLGSAPPEYAARVQAVAALAQVLPVLVTSALLGYLADVEGARTVVLICAGATVLVAVLALGSKELRGVRRAES